jgi:hypothetical protein
MEGKLTWHPQGDLDHRLGVSTTVGTLTAMTNTVKDLIEATSLTKKFPFGEHPEKV